MKRAELFPKSITLHFEGDALAFTVKTVATLLVKTKSNDGGEVHEREVTTRPLEVKRIRRRRWEIEDDEDAEEVDSIDAAVQSAAEWAFEDVFQEIDFSDDFQRGSKTKSAAAKIVEDESDEPKEEDEEEDEDDDGDGDGDLEETDGLRGWVAIAHNTWALEVFASPEQTDAHEPLGCLVRYTDDNDGHMVFVDGMSLRERT